MKFAKIDGIKSFTLSIFLVFILVPMSQGGAAWKKIGTDQDGPNYLELTTIRKEKGFVFYEMLSDYSEAGRSSVSLVQADCSSGRIKLLQAKAYSRPMAKGYYKTYKPVPRWVSAKGNKVIKRVLSFVCQ